MIMTRIVSLRSVKFVFVYSRTLQLGQQNKQKKSQKQFS